MTFHVYCRTNTITKKKYVGVTGVGIERRWEHMLEHVDELLERQQILGRQPKQLRQQTIYADIVNLGRDCWEHEVLDVHNTIFFALVSERRWIKRLNTNINAGGEGYNLSQGGELVLRCGGAFSIEDMAKFSTEMLPFVLDDSLSLPDYVPVVCEKRPKKRSREQERVTKQLDELACYLSS